MRSFLRYGALAVCLLGATIATSADRPPTTQPKKDVGLYDGFDADAALLRDVQEVKGGEHLIRASSFKAQQAAQRIFSRVAFLFRSRAEVLTLLGDPATISDYGRRAGKGENDPLVYVFDSGEGGLTYHLEFSARRCVSVKVESLE